MNRLVISLIAIFAGVTIVFAQTGEKEIPKKMVFKKTTHDFGTLKEEMGTASYTFEFTNTGSEELIIQHVKAACKCSTPEWTKTAVKKGGSGIVKVTYNISYNANGSPPGSFTKTISVTTNTGEEEVLTITGVVTPKEKTEKQ